MSNRISAKTQQNILGSIKSHTRESNNFIFTIEKGPKLKIQVLSDKVIRFRYSITGEFPDDFSYAVVDEFDEKTQQLSFNEENEIFKITTAELVIEIAKKDSKISLKDTSGKILTEDASGFEWEESTHNGDYCVSMSKKAKPEELYFGLGDKVFDHNLRGKTYINWAFDAFRYTIKTDPLYRVIPFFMGLHENKGYGIFFDNTYKSYFDFDSEYNSTISFSADGGEMNYYFIHGPELIDVVKSYTKLTGTAELPPLWAMGYHQCKWSYYPDAMIKNIAEGFRKRNIPCDAIYLDIDYMEGYRCFTWSKERFPNPKKMIQNLKDDGFKLVVIIDPGIKIDENYQVYKEGKEKDLFCKMPDGSLMVGPVWPGMCNFPDFTNPKARDWWADQFKGLIAEDGVKGVWNDMNEPAVFAVEGKTFPLSVKHDYDGHPTTHRKGHNVYGMQMARATQMGLKKASKNRPFVITRAGYAGVQRHSSVWTGDNTASWEHLYLANIQCQRLSISGVSFVGSDIGGFYGVPDGELYIRWLQLGIFHPLCRTHSIGHNENGSSATDPNFKPDTNKKVDQEPWSFGEENTEIARNLIELRYKLLPYLYTTFYQYSQLGTPMLKPLFVYSQEDHKAYSKEEEFILGDHILLSPITREGAQGKEVYLPKGRWYSFWNDEPFEGQQEVWVEAFLDSFPMFIKAGAVIPFYPVMQYVGEKSIDIVTLHTYFTKNEEESTFYEDGGDGYDYLNGGYSLKKFFVKGESNSLSITQNKEGNLNTGYKEYEIILHGLPFMIKKAFIDDKDITSQLKSTSADENFPENFSIKVDANFKTIKFLKE